MRPLNAFAGFCLLVVFTISLSALGQCPNDNIPFYFWELTDEGETASTTCIFGGEYASVNVIEGATYVVSACGTSFDTQITVYDVSSGAVVGYNDDDCEEQSALSFISASTGSVNILLDKYNCQDEFSCGELSVTLVSLGQNSGCTDVAACNYDSDAIENDGSCTYPEASNLDCDGNCLNDADGDLICDEDEVGCTDPDTEGPTILNTPGNISLPAEEGLCGATVSWTIPNVLDNCGVTSFTASQEPDDFYAVGITPVTYTAMDAAGNLTVTSFTITITDGQNPSISQMPADINSFSDADACGTTVTWDTPVANDNCNVATLTSSSNSGDFFGVGEHTVTYTATDVNGNSVQDSFTIVVTDNTAPTVVTKDIQAYLNDLGVVTIEPDQIDDGSTDNCEISFRTLNQEDEGEILLDCDNLGPQEVTLTVIDNNSNSTSETATITVIDNIAPDIAEMSDLEKNNTSGTCEAYVSLPDPVITDNCHISKGVVEYVYPSGSVFPLGNTTVSVTYTDPGGLIDVEYFTVTVKDSEPPVFVDVPNHITQSTDEGSCTATVNWSATATDNCPHPPIITSNPPSGSQFAPGDHEVTVQAFDNYGNVALALFNITVTYNDSDSDGICDNGDNCSNTSACNFSDPVNADCIFANTGYDCDGNCLADADGDGICDEFEVAGCTDGSACNYDSSATDDNGSCTYAASGYDCDGNCLADADGDGICDEFEVAGCTDGSACNYDSSATDDNGSCTYAASGYDCDGNCLADADGDGICDEFEVAGCTDGSACNYDSSATDDNGSCTYAASGYDCDGNCLADADGDGICDEFEVPGCTDGSACNYDSSATDDNGSCTYAASGYDCDGNCLADADGDGICDEFEVPGCTDGSACNYDSSATDDNGSCTYAASGYDCDGNCLADADGDGICDEFEVPGCTDGSACNYDSSATDDNGSCTYAASGYDCDGNCLADADGDGICDEFEVPGCTDGSACNYDSSATDDNGSCTYAASGYDCDGNCLADADGDGICDEFEIAGCTDGSACNYNSSATDDDGSCTYAAPGYDCDGNCLNDADSDEVCDEFEVPGCTDGSACNYDPNATDDDWSCTYPASGYDCDGSCLADADGDGICDEFEVPGCTDGSACNYDSSATDDNGSCTYPASGYDCDGNCLADADGDGICDEFEVPGCTDGSACNYDSSATDDNGSCTYAASGYDCDGNCLADADGDGICDEFEVPGCTDGSACNYDSSATDDNGSCTYPASGYDCDGNCLADADGDGICDEFEVPGCTDGSACNYNTSATDDDGTCTYATDPCDACSGQTDGSGTVVAWAGDTEPPTIDNIPGNINLTVEQGQCTAQATWNTVTSSDNCGIESLIGTFASGAYFDIGNTQVSFTATDYNNLSVTETFTVSVAVNDFDGDGYHDCEDADIDGDGVPNTSDDDDFNPNVCRDDDGDNCDDCSSGEDDPSNDGPDSDGDGFCDFGDNCSDPLANNYLDSDNGECEDCPNAPIFDSIYPITPASTLSALDGAIELLVTGTATVLHLEGINGAPNYEIQLPNDLDTLQAGYYNAMIQDAEGCWGVSDTSVGGTTLQQPAISLELIIPFKLCCSGCGDNDIDADGLCDEDDNCTNQTAINFADPENSHCIIPGCTNPDYSEYNSDATEDDGSCETMAAGD